MYTLKQLNDIAENCQNCKLADTRTKIVFGEGDENADIMFVGEAPGYNEDLQGKAFIGKAGQLLTKAINAIGFKRKDVYICNILKCRPPKNRDPQTDEIKKCLPFLRWQFALIKPKIIVCLGRIASTTIIDSNIKITKDRGKWIEKNGVWFLPTFHPSAVLRDDSKKLPLWEDFKEIKSKYQEILKKTKK